MVDPRNSKYEWEFGSDDTNQWVADTIFDSCIMALEKLDEFVEDFISEHDYNFLTGETGEHSAHSPAEEIKDMAIESALGYIGYAEDERYNEDEDGEFEYLNLADDDKVRQYVEDFMRLAFLDIEYAIEDVLERFLVSRCFTTASVDKLLKEYDKKKHSPSIDLPSLGISTDDLNNFVFNTRTMQTMSSKKSKQVSMKPYMEKFIRLFLVNKMDEDIMTAAGIDYE